MKCKKTIICVPKYEGPQGPRDPRGIQGSPDGISAAAYIWRYGATQKDIPGNTSF